MALCPGLAQEPKTPTVSDQIKAAIRASVPRYQPSIPTAPAKGTDDAFQMPKFIVKGGPMPVPEDRDMFSDVGLGQLLKEQYRGATVPGKYVLTTHLANYAVVMRRDDVRLKDLNELNDLADLIKESGGRDRALKLKDAIQDAFIRREDSVTEAMDKSVNGGRR